MKIQTITAVSVLALMISLPAYAVDVSATSVGAVSDIKSGLDNAGDAINDAATDIKVFFVGKDADKLEPILIHRNMTAHGLMGETIINISGKKVATVKDIILNKNGKAILVVVSDDGFLGIGSKVAAFNYDKVVAQQPDGKVVMTLSRDMIFHAVDFSYDQKDWAKAKIIPTGSISVNALLKGDVLDNNGNKIASVENIYLRDADVSQIIVGFDKKLGLGGSLAALDYDDLQMVRNHKELDFELTPAQTARFESFTKSVAN